MPSRKLYPIALLLLAMLGLLVLTREMAGPDRARVVEPVAAERGAEDVVLEPLAATRERLAVGDAASHSDRAVEERIPRRQVLVRSHLDAPVIGAEVWMTDGGSVLAHATTDAGGECRLPLPQVSELLLVVRARGFASHQRELDLRADPVVIRLQPAATLRGRVMMENRQSLGRPARVYAWRTVDDPEPGRLGLADGGVPVLHAAITGEDGSFEITDVSSTATYSVAAGAPGWVCREVVRGVQPPAHGIDVVLWRLHACVLSAKLPDGRAPPPSLLANRTWGQPPNAEWVEYPSALLAMAGLARVPGVADHGTDWRRAVLSYIAPFPEPALGPLQITYAVPGYERLVVSSLLPAFTGGRIVEHRFTITPLRPTRVLTLVFQTGQQWPPDAFRGVFLSPMHVELLRVGSDGEEPPGYRIPIRDLSVPYVVPGVPVGEYRLRVIAANGTWPYPARSALPLVVAADDPTVKVPLASLGAVLLQPEACSGATASRHLRVVARQAGEHRVEAQFAFHGPPYLLAGLPPGTWTMDVHVQYRLDEETKIRVAAIEVGAARTTTASFRCHQ